MLSYARNKLSPLPYASLVAAILEDFGIDPIDSDMNKRHEINLNSLSRMGYEKKKGAWVKKIENAPRRITRRKKILEKFSGVDTRVDSLDRLATRLQDRIQALEGCVDALETPIDMEDEDDDPKRTP